MKLPAYSKYKPSDVEWLGEIAYDWTVSPIKHLVSTPVTDGPHETPEIFDEGIPFVSAEAVSGGRINFEKIRGHITAEDHKRFSRKYKPRRGDIYLIKSGATTGRVAMVETDNEFNIWSPLAAIRCDPQKANRHFLFFYMQSKEFQTAVELSWSFGTQQNIGMGVIQNLAVPLPSLTEQQAIADFLDCETARLDALVAKKKKLIERLKEKRIALISRTVTRGLNPKSKLKSSGYDWLGDVPEHWEVRKFSREVAIAEGQVDPEKEPYASMLLIGPEHVESGTGRLLQRATAADQAAESGKYFGRKGDVIYSKIRPALRKLVIAPADCLCSADMYPLRARKRLDNRFIAWFFLSEEFSGWSVLESDRVAMPKINRDTLNELRMPVPPLPEQAAIAEFLERETAKLDALVAKVETAVERLQEYRTALITAAVTGKIDVRKESNGK